MLLTGQICLSSIYRMRITAWPRARCGCDADEQRQRRVRHVEACAYCEHESADELGGQKKNARSPSAMPAPLRAFSPSLRAIITWTQRPSALREKDTQRTFMGKKCQALPKSDAHADIKNQSDLQDPLVGNLPHVNRPPQLSPMARRKRQSKPLLPLCRASSEQLRASLGLFRQ